MFKVGVQLHPQHTSFDDYRRAWLAADVLGVDMIVTWDHFFASGGWRPGLGAPVSGRHGVCEMPGCRPETLRGSFRATEQSGTITIDRDQGDAQMMSNADTSSTQEAESYPLLTLSDPGRIPQMLNLLRRVWTANPEWRLGQLIVNMQHEAAVLSGSSSRLVPLFDIEDARLYAGLAHLAETSIKMRSE